MDKYYYLTSLFPTLYFDKPAKISVASFLQEAEKWLSRRDFSIVRSINLNDVAQDKSNPSSLREYKEFEYQLRSDLASWRKAKQIGTEYKPQRFASSIVKEGNPLEIEIKLMRMRWDFLEEKERDHHFNLEFLIIYYLKLQILQRLNQFNKDKGIEKYQSICRVSL